MHKFITLSLLTASLILGMPIESKSETSNDIPPLHNERLNNNGNSGRSRSRSINKPLWCYYSNGQICFELPADIDYMEVEITDANGCTWNGFVSQDDPCCDIPPMSGAAYIEATTDSGATMSATLIF